MDSKKDFVGNPLPDNTTSMVVSMQDISDSADGIHKLIQNKVLISPITAMGLVMMGLAMLRFLGVTTNTCKTISDGILDQYKHIKDTGRDGRMISHEEGKKIDAEVKRCFNAPGNNTIN